MNPIEAPARAPWTGRRVLITGIGGFTGRHLAAELDRRGARITGFDLAEPEKGTPGEFHRIDLLDQTRLAEYLEAARPEVVFHLAALLRSADPGPFYNANAGGTAVLLDAVRSTSPRPLVVLLSSGAVYGPSTGSTPIAETQPLRPVSHYALSKLFQEWIAGWFRDEHGLQIVTCRPFNLSGPGLPATLSTGSFARQIVCAERTGSRAVRVGRLGGRRDFVDVRDAVRAYLAVAEKGEPGETYNICSGESRSISESLDILVRLARTPIEIEQDPALSGPGDVDDQVGDPARLHAATGWEPVISFEQSLSDMLDHWRTRADACG